ncbi:hypothetical protein C791_7057 [Amycolatopsis azurea DSM 43854]|uniref:Uncharacterized protein n=1 Tax=Amycolatopsis azurea DSM 43854 TaxID=1238180 RepID=M2QA98_9PSEU|nr:hypothetical protein C791_7057 [Amycolatopsis azurea DSM 43854]
MQRVRVTPSSGRLLSSFSVVIVHFQWLWTAQDRRGFLGQVPVLRLTRHGKRVRTCLYAARPHARFPYSYSVLS